MRKVLLPCSALLVLTGAVHCSEEEGSHDPRATPFPPEARAAAITLSIGPLCGSDAPLARFDVVASLSPRDVAESAEDCPSLASAALLTGMPLSLVGAAGPATRTWSEWESQGCGGDHVSRSKRICSAASVYTGTASPEARYDLRFVEGAASRQLDFTLRKSPEVRVAAPQVRPDSELVIELDGELTDGVVQVVLRAQGMFFALGQKPIDRVIRVPTPTWLELAGRPHGGEEIHVCFPRAAQISRCDADACKVDVRGAVVVPVSIVIDEKAP